MFRKNRPGKVRDQTKNGSCEQAQSLSGQALAGKRC
jgi:hypothetical protein